MSGVGCWACREAESVALRRSPIFDWYRFEHSLSLDSYTYPRRSLIMTLVIPPPNRSRASSTCVRPALSINTLGRRRSSSLVLPVQHTPDDTASLAQSPTSQSSVTTSHLSMLSLIAAKCLEFLHMPKLHPSDCLSPSSPLHSSQADLVLPLSASSQSTFGDILNEKDASSHRWPPFHPSVSDGPFLDLVSHLTSLLGACTNPLGHAPLPPVYFRSAVVTLLPTHLSHVATNTR